MVTRNVGHHLLEQAVGTLNALLSNGHAGPDAKGQGPSAMNAACAQLGLSDSTLRSRLKLAKRDLGLEPNWASTIKITPTTPKPFELPRLPSELPTAEALIVRRKDEYERKHAASEARRLVPVKIKINGPIAIAHLGDPHVDNPGTDLGKLERHMQVINATEGMFGANVGDLHDNWVGRLARLYSESSTSAAEAWVLVEWMVRSVQWLYLLAGNHDCHDEQTECLTRRGWVSHKDIRHDDLVLSYDADTGVAAWHPITEIIFRRHEGEMVRIDANGLSLCATPNHRVLHSTLNSKMEWRPWSFTTAADLPARLKVPVSGDSLSEGVALSDDELALAGWILTDGNIRWTGNSPRITLYQSKSGTEIDRLLAALNLAHSRTTRVRDITEVCGRTLVKPPLPQTEWRLTAAASRIVLEWLPEKGRLPSWANELSTHQFSVLLDAFIAGDGVWDGADPSAKVCAVLHGTKDFLSSVQAVAVQHGWRARLAVTRGKDWRLNLAKTDFYSLWTAPVTTREQCNGDVWCLTVPLGNFMVRRDGVAHFSGNCWSGAGDPVKWIASHAGLTYEAHGSRLNLLFPGRKDGVRVNARHDFPGHSMWNSAHGPAKAVQMGWRDHILTCGHKHTSGYQFLKDPATGLISHALRVAGYKIHDRYAIELGLPDGNITPTSVTIIDPRFADDDPRLITVIHDVETAAEFLTWLRARK